DAGERALLGRYGPRRAAAPAMSRMFGDVLSSAALLPDVCRRRCRGRPLVGTRNVAQLRDQLPGRAGIRGAVRDRGRRARRGPAPAHQSGRRCSRPAVAPARPPGGGRLRARRGDRAAVVSAALRMTGTRSVAIVGAAESTEIGTVALSALGLATDAARRALADCGLTTADVDGVAISGLNPYLPTIVAHSLGIEARWLDATMVGGCSNLVHLAHAAAAIRSRQCEVVLVTHGESGRSGIGAPNWRP